MRLTIYRTRVENGFALIGALLLSMILLALMAGLFFVVTAERSQSSSDAENNIAQYAAEAGFEKMAADIDDLYARVQAPTRQDILDLRNLRPNLTGIQFVNYEFGVPAVNPLTGQPQTFSRTISSGPNEGLMAQVLPLTLTVETRRPGSNANVRLTRGVEVAFIPVFQFGIFSQSDLTYVPFSRFDFGGRVHTNGNLFLAVQNAGGLNFFSRVTAVGEVIRQETSNGFVTASIPALSPVRVSTAPNGCSLTNTNPPLCRQLALTEGSKVGGPATANNPNWTNISLSTYNGFVRNGRTGARTLTMPFVGPGVGMNEIIRRPPTGENPASVLGQSRLYNQADIRILLADNETDLPVINDPGNVRLENVANASGGPNYTNGVPVAGVGNTFFAEGRTGEPGEDNMLPTWANNSTTWFPPIGVVPAPSTWPLLGGWIRIEVRDAAAPGGFRAVTSEWLELGFARGLQPPNSELGPALTNAVHRDAILTLQMLADRDGDGDFAGHVSDIGESTTVVNSRHNWYPTNMYDIREGETRDQSSQGPPPAPAPGRRGTVMGVFNLVELDVSNLRLWLTGAIVGTGNLVPATTNNGYILYFSDRRGMRSPLGPGGALNGDPGLEDVLNQAGGLNYPGAYPNNILETGEDVNENGQLDTYGFANLAASVQIANSPFERVDWEWRGRKNRVTGARHALRIQNGSLGNLPMPGFTVASENPVYVLGNYNAILGGFGDPHSSAAVIADSVTILSNDWRDYDAARPFAFPYLYRRPPLNARYRMAVAAGKSRGFPWPTWAPGANAYQYGLDGGAYNFIRYLEDWGGQSPAGRTIFYRGSLVSLFYSTYHVGMYKCCQAIYYHPYVRDYDFDTDFLDPNRLPPGTPRFRDVNFLGANQDFTAQ